MNPTPGLGPTLVATLNLVLAAALLAGCATPGRPLAAAPPAQTGLPMALKDVFKGQFLIGAALGPVHFQPGDGASGAFVARHFNAITPGNVLKWSLVHPQPEAYNFGPSDQFVDFGVRHGMFIVGHTLVWHEQVPRWVFEDAQGLPLTREALLARLRAHIHTVVGRYRGRVQGWDVVNEALNGDGSLRSTPWRTIIGDDYIAWAFRFAHEADPGAALYYNDYSLENPAKRMGAVRLVQALQQAGIAIAGVGLQGHNRLDWPTVAAQDATIQAFADLGVKVMVTELDIDVLPRVVPDGSADVAASAQLQPQLNPYAAGLPDAVQQQLAQRYAELFAVYRKHAGTLSRVSFWGVSDADSWLNNWPVKGRSNHPLLFDRQGQPKPAFDAVVRGAQQAAAPD